jgi:ligand-binding sensor domain-containing protein
MKTIKTYFVIVTILFFSLKFDHEISAQSWTILKNEYPIVTMKQLRDGRVLVITQRQINWYSLDGKQLSVISIPVDSSSVSTFYEDKNGNMWFGTQKNIILRYDGKDWKSFNAPDNYYKNSFITKIFEDNIGNIWFGTYGGGVLQFNGIKWLVHNSENEHLSENHISNIFQDNQGSIWFSTWNGISKFSNNTWYQYYNTKSDGNGAVYAIFQDRSNNVWFGRYSGGLLKYNGNTWTEFNDFANNHPSSGVGTVFQDKENNIWFGTGNWGYGIYKYDGKTFTPFKLPSGGYPLAPYITNIVQDKEGSLWAGTLFGISKYENKEWKAFYPPSDGRPYGFSALATHLIIDRKGNSWIGTNTGLILINYLADDRKLDEGIIYPNPAQSDIEIFGIPNGSKISIFNQLGMLIKQFSYEDFIILDDIPNGVYFVQIETENNIIQKKLVIAR